jgi:ATPase subunit of ABC transporter with duplicated ATPase domains
MGVTGITVENVSKAFAGKKLFEEVTVGFPAGRRYGLTGPNGAGKTTFMKILMGEIEPDFGHVSRPEKTGFLRQDHNAFDDQRVIDIVISGNKRLWNAMQTKEKLYAKGDKITDEEGMLLGELEGVVAEEDGYSAEANAAELLSGLGIEKEHHDVLLKQIPTGFRLRALLAQALFGNPDALLLDEPTNNLDLDSIRWLEEFLHEYQGVLVTISHDRHFLNEICTHIADIDYETIITYVGNYDEMVITKANTRSRVEAENDEKGKKIAQLQDFVARFSAGTRSSQVQSRKKAMEKLQLSDLKRSNIARPFIKFEQKRASGKQTLTVDSIRFSYDGRKDVIKTFSSLVTKGEKVAIIGGNGVGKTTLCELLAGKLKPYQGSIAWGHEAAIGYFPQEHDHLIPKEGTCISYLNDIDPKAGNEVTRGLLGRMLFSGDENTKPLKGASGGEKVRLLLAKLMLEQPNVLLLDEPTNHLDLESISALTEGMKGYPGTMFFVSHDRNMVSEVATRMWVLREGMPILDFTGTYEEYLLKYPPTAHPKKKDE